MTYIKALIFCFVILLCRCEIGISQEPVLNTDSYKGSLPTKPAASIGSANYSGALNINIPLCGISVPGFTTNFSMIYSYKGARVGTTDGEFGLGWHLSGNWTVSRTIRGEADDNVKGLLNVGLIQNSPSHNRNDLISTDNTILPERTYPLHNISSNSNITYEKIVGPSTSGNNSTNNLLQDASNLVLGEYIDTDFDIYTLNTPAGRYRFNLYNSNNIVKINKLDPIPFNIQAMIEENSSTKVRTIKGFRILVNADVYIDINQTSQIISNENPYGVDSHIAEWAIKSVYSLNNNQSIMDFSYSPKYSNIHSTKYIRTLSSTCGSSSIEGYSAVKSTKITKYFITSINSVQESITFTQYPDLQESVPNYYFNNYTAISYDNREKNTSMKYKFYYKNELVAFKDSSVIYYQSNNSNPVTIYTQKTIEVPAFLSKIEAIIGITSKPIYEFKYYDIPDLYNAYSVCDKYGYQNGNSVLRNITYDINYRNSNILGSIPRISTLFNTFNGSSSANKNPDVNFTKLGCLKEFVDLNKYEHLKFSYELNDSYYNGSDIYTGGLRLANIQKLIDNVFKVIIEYNYKNSQMQSTGQLFGNHDNINYTLFGQNHGTQPNMRLRTNTSVVYPYYIHEVQDLNGQNMGYKEVEIVEKYPVQRKSRITFNISSPKTSNVVFRMLLNINNLCQDNSFASQQHNQFTTINSTTDTYCFYYFSSLNLVTNFDKDSKLNGTIKEISYFDRNNILVSRMQYEYSVKPYTSNNSFKVSSLFSYQFGEESQHPTERSYMTSSYTIEPTCIQLNSVTNSIYNSNGIEVSSTIKSNIYSSSDPRKLVSTETTIGSRTIKEMYKYKDDLLALPTVDNSLNQFLDLNEMVESSTILNNSFTTSHILLKYREKQLSNASYSLPHNSPANFTFLLEGVKQYSLVKRKNVLVSNLTNSYGDILSQSSPGIDYLLSPYIESVNTYNLPLLKISPYEGIESQIVYDNNNNVLSTTGKAKYGLAYFNTFDHLSSVPQGVDNGFDYSNTTDMSVGFGGKGKSLVYTGPFSSSYTVELTREQRDNIVTFEASLFAKCKNIGDNETVYLVMFLHTGSGASSQIPGSSQNFQFSLSGSEWRALKGRLKLKREQFKSVLKGNQPLYFTVYLAKGNSSSNVPCLMDELLVRDLASSFASVKVIGNQDNIKITSDSPDREYGTSETKIGVKTVNRDHKGRIISKSVYSGL